MKKSLQLSLLALPVLILSIMAVPVGQAQVNNEFRTPSGNIACAVYEKYLRCDLHENTAAVPARPRDCQEDFGNAFGMGVRGKSKRLCVGDTVFNNQAVLAYGKTWSYQGFVCVAQMNGLTCKNADKKGWFLNKVEQKLLRA